jgi:WD40 repeat protein
MTGRPAVSADGTEVVAMDYDGIAHIWDAHTLQEIDAVDLGAAIGEVGRVEAVGQGWILVRRLSDQEFLALDRSSLAIMAEFTFAMDLDLEVAPDGSFLLMRHLDTTIHRLETDEWVPRLLFSPGQLVRGLAVSPSGSRVMLGGTDGFVRIIDADSGELVDQLPFEHVSDGHWIDNDHIAVATGSSGTWDTVTLDFTEVVERAAGQLTRTFNDGECRVYRIDPCPTLAEIQSR